MFLLIGREFSLQTNKLKARLEGEKIQYKFIDIDFDEYWNSWLKEKKIIGIPVLKTGRFFCVGYNKSAIDRLISKAQNEYIEL